MTGAWAPAAAFAAGLASSTGPCIAPRLAAAAGVTAGHRGAARAIRIGAFATGSCVGFAGLGSLAGVARRLIGYSPLAYALLAAAFAAVGVAALVRPARGHACGARDRSALPLGAVFLTGVAFAVVGTPCCGPLAGVVVAAAAATRSLPLAAAFALGHALPLVAAGAGWQPVSIALLARVPAPVVSTVGGGVALGLAAYYGLLA